MDTVAHVIQVLSGALLIYISNDIVSFIPNYIPIADAGEYDYIMDYSTIEAICSLLDHWESIIEPETYMGCFNPVNDSE